MNTKLSCVFHEFRCVENTPYKAAMESYLLAVGDVRKCKEIVSDGPHTLHLLFELRPEGSSLLPLPSSLFPLPWETQARLFQQTLYSQDLRSHALSRVRALRAARS